MHLYDFETELPSERDIYDRLVECEKRGNLLYSHAWTRVPEVDGVVAGSLLIFSRTCARLTFVRHTPTN